MELPLLNPIRRSSLTNRLRHDGVENELPDMVKEQRHYGERELILEVFLEENEGDGQGFLAGGKGDGNSPLQRILASENRRLAFFGRKTHPARLFGKENFPGRLRLAMQSIAVGVWGSCNATQISMRRGLWGGGGASYFFSSFTHLLPTWTMGRGFTDRQSRPGFLVWELSAVFSGRKSNLSGPAERFSSCSAVPASTIPVHVRPIRLPQCGTRQPATS